MKPLSRQGLQLTGSALARLLLLLSAVFIVSQLAFERSHQTLHVFYRFLRYIGDLILLRPSITENGVPVAFYIRPAIVRTLGILLPPLVFSVSLAMITARLVLVRGWHRLARGVERLGSVAYSVPVFVVAMILFLLASETRLFPIGSTTSVDFSDLNWIRKVIDIVYHLVLPWLTLSIFPALLLVGESLVVLDQLEVAEHVTVARAHGYDRLPLYRSHIRRPLLGRLLQTLASNLPLILSYAVIVEYVFQYNGLGFYMVVPYVGYRGLQSTGLVVSQGSLVYVGAITIVLQLVIRFGALAAFPGSHHESHAVTRPVLVTLLVAMGAVAVGLLSAVSSADHPDALFLLVGAAVIAAAVTVLLVSHHRSAHATGRGSKPPGSSPHSASLSRTSPPGAGSTRVSFGGRIRPRLFLLATLVVVVLAIHVVPWTLGNLERIPTLLSMRPRGREHPELIWSFFLLAVQRGASLAPILMAVCGGATFGLLAGIGSGYFRLNLIERGVDAVAVFPSVLLLILFSGVAGLAGLPLVLTVGVAAFVRFFVWAQHRARELCDVEFVEYGRAIGEHGAELLRRHVVRNVLRGAGTRFVRLYVDMIVLAANLSFLQLVPYRSGAEAATPGVFGWFISGSGYNWGSDLAGSRSYFIRQTYLPAIWPAVLLILTVAVLRIVAGQLEQLRAHSGQAATSDRESPRGASRIDASDEDIT